MKAPALVDILNLRKPVSHILILLFSLIVTLITLLTGKYSGQSHFSFSMFIMVFAQLEVFIFLGNILFADLNFDKSPAEITRIVLIRFVAFLVACLLLSMIIFVLLQYAGLWIKGEDDSKVIYNFIHFGFSPWFKSTIKGLTIGAIIFIVLLWQTSLRREQKLREENLIFQNETLKSQVNPHFLFNSLNTISSLVQTQPEAAERFINNLSSVYRYILENGQKDKVPLQSELDFITNYYNLHKTRDEEKILLFIDAPDAVRFKLLPVSLQILLENAIKHNIATRENQLKITIYIEDQFIVVKNNLQRKATQLKSMQIGLKNLSERVRLISGRDLIIEETENYFTAKLPLLK
ncbi:MAG TPA: histidine kinase [Bacteroidales bacterium]|nr:histidine kinase [Bacteroidales bacterium]